MLQVNPHYDLFQDFQTTLLNAATAVNIVLIAVTRITMATLATTRVVDSRRGLEEALHGEAVEVEVCVLYVLLYWNYIYPSGTSELLSHYNI